MNSVIVGHFPEVVIDVGGAGDCISKVVIKKSSY
jgi:hypothetical protein